MKGRDTLHISIAKRRKRFRKRKKIEDDTASKPTPLNLNTIDDIDKEKFENKLYEQPFEEYAATIVNQEQWTAAFTVTRILGKPTRTLADTEASHSVVSLNWVKHIGMESHIKPTDTIMVDAQKKQIPVSGTILLLVEFSGHNFK